MPLLRTLMSEVFTKDEWLVAWDHMLSNHPSFFLHYIVAYLIHNRVRHHAVPNPHAHMSTGHFNVM